MLGHFRTRAINILKFYEVYCDVKPKREALAAANKQLFDAQTKLQGIIDMVDQLEQTLITLTNQYKAAIEAKCVCGRRDNRENDRVEPRENQDNRLQGQESNL